MAAKVIASTSGIDNATTVPARRPSEKKLTASTITTASASERTNSATEWRTAAGWSDTRSSFMPTGSVFCRRSNSASSAVPRCTMLPPGRMDTPIPMAFSPMKRMRGAAGSVKPRLTSATSARRKVRPPARIGKSRISSADLKPPETRNCTRSLPVSKNEAGVTAFCASIACCTDSSGMPSVASLVLLSSIQTFSSCRPIRSTLLTSGTRCSCSSTRSA